ncbi:hypothetical protein GIW70_23670 [Pseudomonas syringae]|nr:hypothetical protein [Pseudomonas syringae]MCF5071180.1 hypothetical protein [Pseudomonas syringae]
MSNITREEFNARIETIEARMDARVEATSAKIDAFLLAQAERDKTCLEREKTQQERDKRYELMADRVTKAAEGAEAAALKAAKLNTHYWAGICVQLLAVSAILVGAYCANQANILVAVQTTLSAVQAGKDSTAPATDASFSFQAPAP